MISGCRKRPLKVLLVLFLLFAGCTTSPNSSLQHVDGVAYSEFVPSAGSGPALLLLSGSGGPSNIESVADDLVKLGYYVILSDGRFFSDYAGCRCDRNLQNLVLRAQSSPHARQGKVAVIGFSLGGTGVLAYASTMPELVAIAVAYFPATTRIADREELVHRWKVPTLAFAGEADDGGGRNSVGCCMVGTIRAMATRAKELGAPFELFVYPGAGHEFNWPYSVHYNSAAAEDAWKRTLAALRHYLAATVPRD